MSLLKRRLRSFTIFWGICIGVNLYIVLQQNGIFEPLPHTNVVDFYEFEFEDFDFYTFFYEHFRDRGLIVPETHDPVFCERISTSRGGGCDTLVYDPAITEAEVQQLLTYDHHQERFMDRTPHIFIMEYDSPLWMLKYEQTVFLVPEELVPLRIKES